MKNTYLTYFFALLFTAITSVSLSQEITFTENIGLPDQNGAFGCEIAYANQKLFYHGQNKILVYNESDLSFDQSVDLIETRDEGGNETDYEYGKYAPPFFNYFLSTPARNLFAVNEEHNRIYTITPWLDLISIASDNPSGYTTMVTKPQIIEHFKIASGRVVIKYDPVNYRLYLLLSGRDKDNSAGSFHITDSYFAIYKIKPIDGSIDCLLYDELMRGCDLPECDGYTSTIQTFEYNQNQGSNLIYVARSDKLQVWELPAQPNTLTMQTVLIQEKRIGKMLAIMKGSYLHKIVALPYSLPDESLTVKNFYTIDGNNPSATWHAIESPNRRILDAIFLPENDVLAMTYADFELDINPDYENSDIAFFQYSSNSYHFEPRTDWNLATNGFPLVESTNEYNYPFKMILDGNNSFFLGKKNEIIRVSYNDTEPTQYESEQTMVTSKGFFVNGIKTQAGNYFTSLTLNGFYRLDPLDTVQTGFPVYQSVYNPTNGCIYFYNTLQTDHSGLFVYNTVTNHVDSYKELNFPIGDVVYNPFQGHILISNNSSGQIRILKPDNNFDTDLVIGGVQNIAQLYVSPNGLLCFLSNSKSIFTKMHTYDATDYTDIRTESLFGDITKQTAKNLNANFCYNPYNQKIYATITNTPIIDDPYNSVPNSCSGQDSFNNSILLSIDDEGNVNVEITETDIKFAKEVICPELLDPPADYQGELYICSDPLIWFDCATGNFEEIDFTPDDNVYFNDIEYSQHTNTILGFSDQTISYIPPTQGYANDRVARYYKIERQGQNQYTKTLLDSYEGQIASFFVNPYNGLLYVHTKFDGDKWGSTKSQLFQYDPANTSNTQVVDLGNITSYYAEFDHFEDALINLFNYNLTTPFINPATNKIYLPNGAHSNVSVVEFEATEILSLNPPDPEAPVNPDHSITWLSIPRHNRPLPPYENTLTQQVFAQSKIDGGYETFLLEHNFVEVTPSQIKTAEWTQPTNWEIDDDMVNTNSIRGYKLDIYQNPLNNHPYITLTGDVQDPATPIDLYSDKDNWVGYFLYQEQDIFDALGITLNYVNQIKTQHWCCTFHGPFTRQFEPVAILEGWECDDRVHNINYGDMVVLETDYVQEGYTFSWFDLVTRESGEEKADAQYFNYQEELDYTPVYIELDGTNNPLEIGAFVNDSCVGACTVRPDDTLTGILTYMNNTSGDSLTFENWYGTKSGDNVKLTDYIVFNPERGHYEDRIINPREGRDYYKVSFRKDDKPITDIQSRVSDISIFPNPTSGQLTIEYKLLKEADVRIETRDMLGRSLKTISHGTQPVGYYSLNFKTLDNMGIPLRPGIYLLHLVVAHETTTKKIVIN
ncbi:MAG: T9SS type A sorting domain-containing protein [Bacteroidetes bacterium]|nr:T9SS type A sorting domain-containing protein [Bacteroidota bacterium]